jgi:two-component system, chemotaxis family, sensor kinase CheA
MMEGQPIENDEMQEIINDFVIESSELVENVIQDIVAIEENPDEEVVNGIFRAVHTVKGTSSFLGFGILSTLAHKAEDLLGMIRKGEIKIDKEIADTLLEALDSIKSMIDDIRTKGTDDRDTASIVEKLERLAKVEKKKLGEILVEEKVLSESELNKVLEKQKTEKDKKLGEIVVEEKLITEGQLNNILTKQKVPKDRDDQTVRIDVKKLDELMNLVGELVLGKNRLMMVNTIAKKASDNGGVLDNLEDVTNYIEVITNDLQLSIMKARLVPLSKVFNKVPRMVRDLCSEFKKDISLKISGEETELDRSLIESLTDPLIHIIRNSVDHGIETPEDRRAAGKEEKGILSITAYNEGNNVMIEVFDDGKGINLPAVKEKVKEKGLMSEQELNNLSDKEAMNLVFIPGLSTAKKVTSVSGRGVGMDVVRTNIEKMNGQAYIDSEYGKWTKLTIKLPLTLAIMRALIVKIAEEFYAIPLNNVIELVKLRNGSTKTVDKNEVFMLRDIIIPILDMSKVFLSHDKNTSNGHSGYLVICKISEKTIGVKVQAVVGQEEVVIKPLGEFMGNVNGVGGATIRGDGKVILILDVPAMINNNSLQNLHKRGNSVSA